jgi:Flp pilus assembly protein TadG
MDKRSLSALGTRSQGERGQILVIVAMVLAILCGMTAMAVDFGSYATDRRNLQNAADAIALAAAQELPNTTAATTAANTYATENDIPLSDVTLSFTPQSLPSQPNPKVSVTIDDTHAFLFANVIGISEADVSAHAAAIKTSAAGSDGLMPWSVIQSFAHASAPGTSLVLKYDAGNSTNGNFGALRLDGNGSNVYRDTIINGSTTPYCASGVTNCPHPSVVSTETGNMRGSTRTGVDNRLATTTLSCDTWDEVVTVNGDGTHHLNPACNPFGPGGNPASRRVVVIPLIDSLCNGSCDVTIMEFALFFLEGYGPGGCSSGNNCEVRGKFINSNQSFGSLTGVYDASTLNHFTKLVE